MLLTGLDRYRGYGLLLLRVGFGVMFLMHGLPKLLGGPEMWQSIGQNMQNFGITFGYPFWGFMSGAAEAGGGVLLMAGFLFRYTCLIMLINMIVATRMHMVAGDPFSTISHPIEAGIVFLSLILIGPGRFALDELISRRHARPSPINDPV